MGIFDQDPYPVRFEWGSRGARGAAERGDIVVIVDTLRFSSAVIAAAHAGMEVYPVAPDQNAQALAAQVGAEVASIHQHPGRYSLSPLSLLHAQPGTRLVLPSINGSMCSAIASRAAAVLIGALLNASAAATYALELQRQLNRSVTVVACGEQWGEARVGENQLRPALEDYLGAGAILANVESGLSPEAQVARAAFIASREHLAELLWDSGSGRELRAKGWPEDLRFASQLNFFDVVPRLYDGAFHA